MVFEAQHISKWLRAELGGHSQSGKTEIWFIRNVEGRELGNITWHCGWRKYVFESFENNCYEEQCLRDIATFLENLTKKHKEGRKQ
jgi:hypothetical protein